MMVKYNPAKPLARLIEQLEKGQEFICACRPNFFFYRFLDCSFPPLSYCLPIHSRSLLKPSHFHPLPTSSPSAKQRPPDRCPHPPPSTCQPPPLIPALHSTCLRLPPFPVTVRSPCCRSWYVPRFLLAHGGFTRCGSLRASVSLPRHP